MNTSISGTAALPAGAAGRPRMFCHACGTSIDAQAEICPACGVRQRSDKERVSKAALLLMTFFLGGIGGHKFYLGKPGMGILYLFTFGLFTIGWIVDLFTLPNQVRRVNTLGF